MTRKIAFFGFNGEMTCFGHVLINARDLYEKGNDTKVIIEGASTKLLPELYNGETIFSKTFHYLLERNLIDSVCKACSNKMGTLNFAKEKNLPLGDDLYGHPSMDSYLKDGYEIITI